MLPLQIRRFQLVPASPADADWLTGTLDRESRRFAAQVRRKADGRLVLCRDGCQPASRASLSSGTSRPADG
jgi:hypothetical protein